MHVHNARVHSTSSKACAGGMTTGDWQTERRSKPPCQASFPVIPLPPQKKTKEMDFLWMKFLLSSPSESAFNIMSHSLAYAFVISRTLFLSGQNGPPVSHGEIRPSSSASLSSSLKLGAYWFGLFWLQVTETDLEQLKHIGGPITGVLSCFMGTRAAIQSCERNVSGLRNNWL